MFKPHYDPTEQGPSCSDPDRFVFMPNHELYMNLVNGKGTKYKRHLEESPSSVASYFNPFFTISFTLLFRLKLMQCLSLNIDVVLNINFHIHLLKHSQDLN